MIAAGLKPELRAVVYNEPGTDLPRLVFLGRENFMSLAKFLKIEEQMETYDFLAFSGFANYVSIITHDYDYTAA